MRIFGIVAAAGFSSRMGNFKPLLPVAGCPMVAATANSMLQGGVHHVLVVTGYRGDELRTLFAARADSRVSTVYNPAFASSDMLESIKVGLREALQHKADAVCILPGDMPAVSPDTFTKLAQHMQTNGSGLIFPLYQGAAKHPPLIHASGFAHILQHNSGGGLRLALQTLKTPTSYCPVTDPGCTLDADTPQAYAALLDYCAGRRC